MQVNNYNFRVIWYGVLVLLGLLGIYEIGSALYVSQTTGTISIKASDAKALLSVSEAGHRMVNVGHGQSNIHLVPGNYKIYASLGRLQTAEDIQVTKKNKSQVSLQLPGLSAQSRQLNKNAQANSLIKLLPYTGPNSEYVISYRYTVSGGVANPIIVITTSSDKAKQDALAWITRVGFNTGSLVIQYQTAAE
jgi:hypothetical protein